MNIVTLIGRMTADPEVRYMNNENQTAYLNFTLAVDRDYDREKTDFIRCKAFARTAEIIEEYCVKGQQIAVMGSWETSSYEDKKGNTVYTNDCRVDRFNFIGNRRDSVEEEPKRKTRKKVNSR